MFVKVIIQRPIQEGNERNAYELLKKIRSSAMDHPGYVTGETLVSTDNPREIMVISTWESMEDWSSWKASEERKALDAKLEKIQTHPTTYKPYTLSKFRISVRKGFPEALG